MKCPNVTVIVPCHNEGQWLSSCIQSILAQTYTDFELILVDDFSTDDTFDIVRRVCDARIKYIRTTVQSGAAAARNVAILQSKGDILFFTDGDCRVDCNWISNALRYFRDVKTVGVEGMIYYVSRDYSSRYSDRVVHNISPGAFMTANMAYRRSAVLAAGLFCEDMKRKEDRYLALRVSKMGKIAFSTSTIVYHCHTRWSPRAYLTSLANEVRDNLILLREFGDGSCCLWRIYHPYHLLAMLCPPLVFASLFRHRFCGLDDLLVWSLLYPRIVYERIVLWQNAVRYRLFVI